MTQHDATEGQVGDIHDLTCDCAQCREQDAAYRLQPTVCPRCGATVTCGELRDWDEASLDGRVSEVRGCRLCADELVRPVAPGLIETFVVYHWPTWTGGRPRFGLPHDAVKLLPLPAAHIHGDPAITVAGTVRIPLPAGVCVVQRTTEDAEGRLVPIPDAYEVRWGGAVAVVETDTLEGGYRLRRAHDGAILPLPGVTVIR